MSLSPFPRRVFPGSILCQGDAPEGCGSGMQSTSRPGRRLNEPSNSQLADGNHKRGTQETELCLEPAAAGLDLVRCGNAVASLGILPGKAAAHGGKVDAVADFVLGPSEGTRKPLEECLACGPGKRPAHDRLLVARRLADQHDLARDAAADHDRLVHPRAAGACAEFGQMSVDGGLGHGKKKDGGPVGLSILRKISLGAGLSNGARRGRCDRRHRRRRRSHDRRRRRRRRSRDHRRRRRSRHPGDPPSGGPH
jgi:hypothetical protein